MRIWALGLAVAALLGGCGGSDDDGDKSANPAPPSRRAQPRTDEYAQRLDALCKDARPELAQIQSSLTQARDAARSGRVGLAKTFRTFAALLTKANVASQRFDAQLRALRVPRGEMPFHNTLLGSVEASRLNLREQVSASKAQDSVRLRELSVKGSVIQSERRGLFEGHGGFRVCNRADGGR